MKTEDSSGQMNVRYENNNTLMMNVDFASLHAFRNCISMNDFRSHIEAFEETVKINPVLTNTRREGISLTKLKTKLLSLPNSAVFYGAGQNMKTILSLYNFFNIQFSHDIWDMDAATIGQISGNFVHFPDFKTKVSNNSTMIVTISSKLYTETVTKKLQTLGWNVIDASAEILGVCDKDGKTIPPVEFSDADNRVLDYVRDNRLTMVSDQRLFATLAACKYVIENDIEGDFVECGVWRGGNAIVAAEVFKHSAEKKIWLFDTYEGFITIKPTEKDGETLTSKRVTEESLLIVQEQLYDAKFCGNSIDDVRAGFQGYGLLSDKIMFIEGDVKQTLKTDTIPQKISVLRLDTDFYESTKKEIEVLYPRLTIGGVLLIDDYGYCDGVRSAIDEYFCDKPKPLLQYIDYAGRLVIKTK